MLIRKILILILTITTISCEKSNSKESSPNPDGENRQCTESSPCSEPTDKDLIVKCLRDIIKNEYKSQISSFDLVREFDLCADSKNNIENELLEFKRIMSILNLKESNGSFIL